MSTQEVANRWAELCRTGQFDQAVEELYDENCVSIEMKGAQGFPYKLEGLDAIKQKGEQFNQMVEAFHGVAIEGPLVADNHFTATMKMDITMKGQPRTLNEEVTVYQVKDGKIVAEQFFYDV